MKAKTRSKNDFSSDAGSNLLDRRGFIKSSALGLGTIAAWNVLPAGAMNVFMQEAGPLWAQNPLYKKEKLNIQFVISSVIHESNALGPCRGGTREMNTQEKEYQRHMDNFAWRKQQLKSLSFPREANILEPVDFQLWVREKNVEFDFPESEFAKLEEKVDQVDLFIVLDGFTGDVAVKLAQRYKKPVATVAYSRDRKFYDRPFSGWLVDMAAALRQRGLEGYVALDWKDMNRIISLLWIKKAFDRTKLLIFTDRFGKAPFGMESVIYDFDALKSMYGMEYHHASNQDLGNEIERIRGDESELNQARQITKDLMNIASAVHMPEKHLLNSIIAYRAARNLMDRFGCNAYTIECREICPLELADKYKFTPCITHSLLKDNGFPSACQTDVNALLAMMAFMYTSKKSTYMGNPEYDVKSNILTLWHDVPGIMMNGFNHDPQPFEIRNFTSEGWGASLKYNFKRDAGKVVTLGRFNAPGTKMFLTKGEIADGFGMHGSGCTLGVDMEVKDARDIFEKLKDFGSHLVMVYGDYTQEINDLSEVLGFEVVSSM